MDKEDKKDEVAEEEGKDKKPEVAAQDKDAGDKPDKDKVPETKDPNAERMDRIERQLDRIERGGSSEAGLKEPEPKKETDDEYAARVQAGKANPVADDGII